MKRNKRETPESAFQLWELILFAKVRDLENLIESIQADLSTPGFNREKSRVFIDAHIKDMQEQIQEQIAASKKRRKKEDAA